MCCFFCFLSSPERNAAKFLCPLLLLSFFFPCSVFAIHKHTKQHTTHSRHTHTHKGPLAPLLPSKRTAEGGLSATTPPPAVSGFLFFFSQHAKKTKKRSVEHRVPPFLRRGLLCQLASVPQFSSTARVLDCVLESAAADSTSQKRRAHNRVDCIPWTHTAQRVFSSFRGSASGCPYLFSYCCFVPFSNSEDRLCRIMDLEALAVTDNAAPWDHGGLPSFAGAHRPRMPEILETPRKDDRHSSAGGGAGGDGITASSSVADDERGATAAATGASTLPPLGQRRLQPQHARDALEEALQGKKQRRLQMDNGGTGLSGYQRAARPRKDSVYTGLAPSSRSTKQQLAAADVQVRKGARNHETSTSEGSRGDGGRAEPAGGAAPKRQDAASTSPTYDDALRRGQPPALYSDFEKAIMSLSRSGGGGGAEDDGLDDAAADDARHSSAVLLHIPDTLQMFSPHKDLDRQGKVGTPLGDARHARGASPQTDSSAGSPKSNVYSNADLLRVPAPPPRATRASPLVAGAPSSALPNRTPLRAPTSQSSSSGANDFGSPRALRGFASFRSRGSNNGTRPNTKNGSTATVAYAAGVAEVGEGHHRPIHRLSSSRNLPVVWMQPPPRPTSKARGKSGGGARPSSKRRASSSAVASGKRPIVPARVPTALRRRTAANKSPRKRKTTANRADSATEKARRRSASSTLLRDDMAKSETAASPTSVEGERLPALSELQRTDKTTGAVAAGGGHSLEEILRRHGLGSTGPASHPHAYAFYSSGNAGGGGGAGLEVAPATPPSHHWPPSSEPSRHPYNLHAIQQQHQQQHLLHNYAHLPSAPAPYQHQYYAGEGAGGAVHDARTRHYAVADAELFAMDNGGEEQPAYGDGHLPPVRPGRRSDAQSSQHSGTRRRSWRPMAKAADRQVMTESLGPLVVVSQQSPVWPGSRSRKQRPPVSHRYPPTPQPSGELFRSPPTTKINFPALVAEAATQFPSTSGGGAVASQSSRQRRPRGSEEDAVLADPESRSAESHSRFAESSAPPPGYPATTESRLAADGNFPQVSAAAPPPTRRPRAVKAKKPRKNMQQLYYAFAPYMAGMPTEPGAVGRVRAFAPGLGKQSKGKKARGRGRDVGGSDEHERAARQPTDYTAAAAERDPLDHLLGRHGFWGESTRL